MAGLRQVVLRRPGTESKVLNRNSNGGTWLNKVCFSLQQKFLETHVAILVTFLFKKKNAYNNGLNKDHEKKYINYVLDKLSFCICEKVTLKKV